LRFRVAGTREGFTGAVVGAVAVYSESPMFRRENLLNILELFAVVAGLIVLWMVGK
jgi:hypothetical protein